MNALFAGKFDPVTVGHMNIIRRAARIFDALHVVVFDNIEKPARFSMDERVGFIKRACEKSGLANVTVDGSRGMVVDYAAAHDINVLVRGIRGADDLPYEMQMARNNRRIYGNIETVFLPADEEFTGVSSTEIRRRLADGSGIGELLP